MANVTRSPGDTYATAMDGCECRAPWIEIHGYQRRSLCDRQAKDAGRRQTKLYRRPARGSPARRAQRQAWKAAPPRGEDSEGDGPPVDVRGVQRGADQLRVGRWRAMRTIGHRGPY